MIINQPLRTKASCGVLGNFLYVTALAFPTWAALIGSLYLIFSGGLIAFLRTLRLGRI
jgi:hypothetical protein